MGHLNLVRKLADGSAVEAYLGQHGTSHYLVQLSRPELSAHADLLGSFLDTSRTSASVHHPELLSPRSFGQGSDGRVWAVSEPITGWTAADALRIHGQAPEGLAVDWGLAVCEALDSLHARGRVHGCVAPRHLHLVGDPSSPQVRLLDTSLLHFRGRRSIATPDGAVVVEAEYLSPERAAGCRGSVASDIWGLGVLMVELLTGHRPFRAGTPDESKRRVLANRRLALPPWMKRWQAFIDACVDPHPVNRFGSALEARQALIGQLA
jgi:serine/threonine-protein kinase